LGRPATVVPWLRALASDDSGANLYRGRAALALGNIPVARVLLERVAGGTRQQEIDARVSILEADLAGRAATPAQIRQLDNLAFTWRGDAVEQRVLRLSYAIGMARHDSRRSIGAAAALIRYCALGGTNAP